VKQNKFPTNEKNSTPLRGVQFSNAYLNSVSEKKNFFPGKFFGGFFEKNDCQNRCRPIRTGCAKTHSSRINVSRLTKKNPKRFETFSLRPGQGGQIFLDTIYQNEGKYTELPKHYRHFSTF
jgi:hypothetical protein